jgi:hypothetical protein
MHRREPRQRDLGAPIADARSTVPPITLETLPKLYGPGPTPLNATSDDLSLR